MMAVAESARSSNCWAGSMRMRKHRSALNAPPVHAEPAQERDQQRGRSGDHGQALDESTLFAALSNALVTTGMSATTALAKAA
jgi:hypothetical protein